MRAQNSVALLVARMLHKQLSEYVDADGKLPRCHKGKAIHMSNLISLNARWSRLRSTTLSLVLLTANASVAMTGACSTSPGDGAYSDKVDVAGITDAETWIEAFGKKRIADIPDAYYARSIGGESAYNLAERIDENATYDVEGMAGIDAGVAYLGTMLKKLI